MGEPAERAGWRSEPVRQGKQAQGDQGLGIAAGRGARETHADVHTHAHTHYMCAGADVHTPTHTNVRTRVHPCTHGHTRLQMLLHMGRTGLPRGQDASCLWPAFWAGGTKCWREPVKTAPHRLCPHAGPQLRRVFGAGALCADGPEPLEQPGAPAVTVVSELAE